MFINKLNESNAKEFWDIRLRALKESPEAFGSSYEEEILNSMGSLILRFNTDYIQPPKDNFIMGAFNENNVLVGIVGFRREKRVKVRHKGSIYSMYVVPEYRRKGVGRLLLAELLNQVKRLEGLEQINLCVVSSNEKAKNLYSSMGFTVYGLEKNALKFDGKYFDEDLMVYEINRKGESSE